MILHLTFSDRAWQSVQLACSRKLAIDYRTADLVCPTLNPAPATARPPDDHVYPCMFRMANDGRTHHSSLETALVYTTRATQPEVTLREMCHKDAVDRNEQSSLHPKSKHYSDYNSDIV